MVPMIHEYENDEIAKLYMIWCKSVLQYNILFSFICSDIYHP